MAISQGIKSYRRKKQTGFFGWILIILIGISPLLSCSGTGGSSEEEYYANPYAAESLRGDWLLWMTEVRKKSFNFFLYIPETAETEEKVPLIIFMHGDDGSRTYSSEPKMKDFGGPLTPLMDTPGSLGDDRREYLNPLVRNSFVVEPQIALIDEVNWNPMGYWNPEKINMIIDYMIEHYPVDENRIYITGLSFGGWGTWYYAKHSPERVAAMIPVCCGIAGTENFENLRGIPTWLFYSFDDGVSNFPGSENIKDFSRLVQVPNIMDGYPHLNGDLYKAADAHYTITMEGSVLGAWQEGVNPPEGWFTYTLYKDGGHNAWDRTYGNDDVWTWLFSQSLDE